MYVCVYVCECVCRYSYIPYGDKHMQRSTPQIRPHMPPLTSFFLCRVDLAGGLTEIVLLESQRRLRPARPGSTCAPVVYLPGCSRIHGQT